MPTSNTIVLTSSGLGPSVLLDHFGVNYLANRQARHNQGIEGENTFGEATELLNSSRFRYPGGTISETHFDITDPRHFQPNGDDLIEVQNIITGGDFNFFTPLTRFLDFAAENRGTVTVVVPIIAYIDELVSGNAMEISRVEGIVKEFVLSALGCNNSGTIVAFELGNEFSSWISGHNGSIVGSSREYAVAARNFSVWIQEALEEAGQQDDIEILIQTPFHRYGELGVRQLIRDFFDSNLAQDYSGVESLADAVEAIDGVTVHSYSGLAWDRFASGGISSINSNFDIALDWQTAVNDFRLQEGFGVRDLSIAITEWNNRNGDLLDGSVSGMQEAISFLSHFYFLVEGGADSMHAWPVLQNNENTLVRGGSLDSLYLEPAGTLFLAMRNSLVNMAIVDAETHWDLDGDGNTDILVFVFQNENRTTFFVSSVSGNNEQFQFDFGDFTGSYNSVSAIEFSMSGLDPLSSTDTVTHRVLDTSGVEGAVIGDAIFDINVSGWGIQQITVFSQDIRQFYGDQVDSTNDQIIGTNNRDEVFAGYGNDTINGLEGNDTLYGQLGDDMIYGSGGGDDIYGGVGDDTVDGGSGRDFVDLGSGDDVFLDTRQVSIWGNDTVYGGNGADLFVYRGGLDEYFGGDGNDVLSIDSRVVFGPNVFAFNITSNTQVGTGQIINIEGKTNIATVFSGGDGDDSVLLTDDDDALFLDDFSTSAERTFQEVEHFFGLGGDDIIDLTSNRFSLSGQTITIHGGQGNDTIWGSDSNDRLFGDQGDDVLFGGSGTNELTGGAGADVFEFTKTSTASKLLDFDPSEGDSLVFYNQGGATFDSESVSIVDSILTIWYFDNEYSQRFSLNIELHNWQELGNVAVSDIASSIFIL